ncbi:MAG: DUF3179 domain-containing (seleno)protein [Candidatus Hodarchaeales archaeon]
MNSADTLGLTVFQDEESGSFWNMRGEAIAGSLAGMKLNQLPGYTAYWFAASSFFVVGSHEIGFGGAKIFAAPSTSPSGDFFDFAPLLIGGVVFSGVIALTSSVVYYYRKIRRS